MSNALPWSSNEVELDVREAARRAARREGLSVGEWLDGVVERRAASRGLQAADLDATERLDAVTEQLVRLARERPQYSASAERILANFESDRRRDWTPPQAPFREGSAQRFGTGNAIIDLLKPVPRPEKDVVMPAAEPAESAAPLRPQAASRDMTDEPTIAAPVADDLGRGAADPAPLEGAVSASPVKPAADLGSTTADPDQMDQVEARLAALFQALDRTPEKAAAPVEPVAETPPPPSVLVVDQPVEAATPPEAKRASLLQNTAMSSAPALEQAIAEIAARQAYLDSTSERAPASNENSGSVAADLLHRYGATRARRAGRERLERSVSAAPPEDRPLASDPQAGAEAAQTPGPALFAGLQAEISGLSRRIEEIHRTAGVRDAALAKETSIGEIRTRLGDLSGKSLDMLGDRVEALAAKIDDAIEDRLSPAAIERLVSRIEGVQASMAGSRDRAPMVDMHPLEQRIDGLVGSVDALRKGSVDARTFDTMMQRLAAKLDDARKPHADAAVFGDLQAQLGHIVQRMDRSDAGLTAIVSVERSLGELFSQLELTREAAINAAETAARTAARETLRAAVMDVTLPFNQSHGSAEAVVANVSKQIAELRATRETADQRLQSMLASLNKTLEKVAERLGGQPLAGEPLGSKTSGAAAAEVLDLSEAASLAPAGNPARATPVADNEPVRVPADRQPLPVALDEADFPIEPGTGPGRFRSPQRREDDAAQANAEDKMNPGEFIAAARRAAQAAAREAANRSATASLRAGAASTAPTQAALGQRVGSFVVQRRRPILLALAGLVLLLGAAQMAHLSRSHSEPTVVGDATPVDDAAKSDMAAPVSSATVPTITKSPEAVVSSNAAGPTAPAQVTAAAPVEAAKPATSPVVPAATSSAVSLDPVKPLPTLAMGFGNKRSLASGETVAGIPAGLKELAQGGNAAAQYEVGLRLADGRGVTRDLKGAADWFEKAANQDLAPAAYRLGSLYEKGLGVARDPVVSTRWYQKAADLGNVRAMHNLAVMSAEGAEGKSDYARAAAWFTKAAQAGVRDSQFNLAILYARGLGIEQSLAQAYTWFAIAADQGDTDAAKKRDEVAARLDAATLASAKSTAEKFKPAATVAAANEVKAPAGGWDAVVPGQASAPGSSSPSAPKTSTTM